MKQTLLITGANGQLGQCFGKIASSYTDYHFIFASSKDLDITNRECVTNYFEKHMVQWCINCAAYTAVDVAESDLENAKKTNVLGVKNLVEACNNNNVTLIHISTDFVFDGSKNTAYNESDIPNPLGIYGKTKLEGEQEVAGRLAKHFIIRTSWLYSEFGGNFLKTMLRLSTSRKNLSIVSDQIGTPTYALDLAKTILHIIKKNMSYGTYHFSNEGVASWYDFAVAIFEITHKDTIVVPIKSEAYPTPAQRPKFSVLDTTNIKRELAITIPHWRKSLEMAIKNIQ